MTSPAPYPWDTRAKGWRFEVDMEKVKTSDTWLRAKTGVVRGALLLLWAEAWQQTPAGTLPNDDELISLLIDMTPQLFSKHKAVLMRGWWLADDGRLYHDTIVLRVQAMLDKRASDAQRAATRRARLADADAIDTGVGGESRVTPKRSRGEFDTKHQAPSTNKTPPTPKGETDGFIAFWNTWPKSDRKEARGKCFDAWRKSRCEAVASEILAHVERMAESEGWTKEAGRFIPAPLVYLNQRRWEGAEPSAPPASRLNLVGGL